MELNNELLLAVPIKDNEIFELLERLAATEEMFKSPVSTIRDVAELTEASPTLIARVLGEMRGPGELEQMVGRLDEHDRRLLDVEQRFSKLEKQTQHVTAPTRKNVPNVVGSTVESERKHAPKVEEPPPAAWVENKRNSEIKKEREYQTKLEQGQEYFIKFWAYIALVVVVGWILYSVLTSPVSSPPISPIVR